MSGTIRIYRCFSCGKGIDSDITMSVACSYCGGKKWRLVSNWTLWESLRYFVRTRTLILSPTSFIGRIADKLNREKVSG